MDLKISELTPNEENHLLELMKAQAGSFVMCHIYFS